uniref:C-type lectin domain-containing protein n=1 Tax=Sparus aurata TaxID=8175 RepID=A0A671V0N3_SPAAU
MSENLFFFFPSGLSALSPNIVREYHYVQMSKTWAQAQSYCREMFADLATVENVEESNRLMSILQGSSTNAWIGLRDDLTRWKWSLGNTDFSTGKDFNNWKLDEPDNYNSMENCTVVTDNGCVATQTCRVERQMADRMQPCSHINTQIWRVMPPCRDVYLCFRT